jgi:rod shape-determining protein MreB
VLSLGGIVVSESVRTGGYDLDEAIAVDVRRRHNLALGQQTAEALKIELGSAWPLSEELQTEIRGRDLVSGLPRQVVLTTEEVREALEEPIAAIVAAVRATLERTPPELAADIVERGIMLAGGGALLRGLDERLRQETHMPVYTAENPLECVAIGAGRSLDEFEAMQRSTRASAGGRRR